MSKAEEPNIETVNELIDDWAKEGIELLVDGEVSVKSIVGRWEIEHERTGVKLTVPDTLKPAQVIRTAVHAIASVEGFLSKNNREDRTAK